MSKEPPTLVEMCEALTEFGRIYAEARQGLCDQIAETFARMEWKPIAFPIKREQP